MAGSSRPDSSIESRTTRCRGGTSSQSSSSSAPCSPQTHAVVHDVVGLRTPTDEISMPVSALNVDDLPDPVAPAIATTVWSGESRSRLPARSTTALGPGEDGSVEPAATSLDGLLEAGESRAQICASGDQLLGPLQQ